MLADLLDPVERGSHAVRYYDAPEALVPTVARFVGGGLAADETVLVVTRPEYGALFDEAMTDAGVDLDGCAGRYYTFDATALLPEFDLRSFGATMAPLVRELTARGPVRVYGELVALLHGAGRTGDAIALESWWNALQARLPVTVLCAYPGAVHPELSATHDAFVASPRPAPRHPGRVTRTFEPTMLAVPMARRFVVDSLRAWGIPEDHGALVVTELATNAVEHTRLRFQVSLTRLGDAVRLAVTDRSGMPLPTAREVAETATGGRGLLLVDAIAREWGCDGDGSGKTVWAMLG